MICLKCRAHTHVKTVHCKIAGTPEKNLAGEIMQGNRSEMKNVEADFAYTILNPESTEPFLLAEGDWEHPRQNSCHDCNACRQHSTHLTQP